MIQLKTSPVGIDLKIARLQQKFYDILLAKWSLLGARYNCYARCYRNEVKPGEYAAEVFDGKEYREVYWDDNLSVVSFFGVAPEIRIAQDNVMTADIHILFFVNLAEIKPGVQRNDEEARLDVQSIIDTQGLAHGWLITKQTTGIDKILNEYPGTRKSEGLKFRDQQPLHCFRFDTQVFYQPTLVKC